MSLHRQAAKRDENEPAIRGRLRAHGWHTEQVSGKGMPDLIGWSRHRNNVLLLETKMPGEGPTTAQVAKWTGLLERGIRVHVLRTDADVDMLVVGRLEPWTPGGTVAAPATKGMAHIPGVSKARTAGGLCLMDHCLISRALGSKFCVAHRPDVSREMKAAEARYASLGSPAIAAETFAPNSHRVMLELLEAQEVALSAPLLCGCTIEVECAEHSKVGG